MKHLNLFLVALVLATTAYADGPLESQVNELGSMPSVTLSSRDSERVYAVVPRQNPLTGRLELGVGGAYQLNSNDYLRSQQLDFGARYFLHPKWFISAQGSYVGNSMSTAGNQLYNLHQILPDAAYVKYRGALQAGYNLFYGKFRLGSDSIFYFDQYVALGPGVVNLDTGTSIAATGDIGFVAWVNDFSFRFGFRDYFYNQQRRLSSGMTHDVVGYLQVGYLL